MSNISAYDFACKKNSGCLTAGVAAFAKLSGDGEQERTYLASMPTSGREHAVNVATFFANVVNISHF